MGILHRRHLRLKSLHALYAHLQNDNGSTVGLKNLKTSCDKVYEMYIMLLQLLADLKKLAEERAAEIKAEKKTLGDAKLPEEIFAENVILRKLVSSSELQAKVHALKINWFRNDPEIVDKVFRTFARSEDYKTYIQAGAGDAKRDYKVVIKIFKQYVVNNEALQKTLEEKSIFWNDDLDIVAVNVLKTLDRALKEDQFQLIPLYKDFEDDNSFMKKLFHATLTDWEESVERIEQLAKNWDVDRIALMDRIIMAMAMAELTSFSEIPVKVTLNEYIELAKEYSTNKSKNFVNGILDKAIAQLREEDKINKTGRGLLDT